MTTTTEEISRNEGVAGWKVRRIFERGLAPEPRRRAGRARLIEEDELPAVMAALRRAGYLPADTGNDRGQTGLPLLAGPEHPIKRIPVTPPVPLSYLGSGAPSLGDTPSRYSSLGGLMFRSSVSEFITREQIAQDYGLPAGQLLEWVRKGRFPPPAIRPTRKVFRWRREDVEAWVRSQSK